MTKRLLYLILFIISIFQAQAQITLINSFNPAGVGGFCGIGFGPTQQQLWVYDCATDSISCLSAFFKVIKSGEAVKLSRY